MTRKSEKTPREITIRITGIYFNSYLSELDTNIPLKDQIDRIIDQHNDYIDTLSPPAALHPKYPRYRVDYGCDVESWISGCSLSVDVFGIRLETSEEVRERILRDAKVRAELNARKVALEEKKVRREQRRTEDELKELNRLIAKHGIPRAKKKSQAKS